MIAPGQTSGSITITGVDDHTTQNDETVVVSIFSIQNATIAGGSQSVTIIRAERRPAGDHALLSSGGSGPAGNVFNEGGGAVTLTATLTAARSTQSITVNLGFSGTRDPGDELLAPARLDHDRRRIRPAARSR